MHDYQSTRAEEAGSALARLFDDGRFAITAEFVPPATGSADDVVAKALPLKGVADAVNVTDNPRARPHMSSLAASAILLLAGIEPIMQIVCRDRNRIALQSDLMGAAALGIQNILILRGDPPGQDSEPDAKGVFDTDSTTLTRIAATMQTEGKLASGRDLVTPPEFLLGVADIPSATIGDDHIARLRERADAGARFIQTQFCFDVDIVRSYANALGEAGLTDRLSILIGIGPLASAKSARWMRENLFGTTIPDEIVARMDGAGDQKSEGTAICAELLDAFADIPGISGAHLMSPVDSSLVPAAIARSNVR